jgi:hypothetical protein
MKQVEYNRDSSQLTFFILVCLARYSPTLHSTFSTIPSVKTNLIRNRNRILFDTSFVIYLLM